MAPLLFATTVARTRKHVRDDLGEVDVFAFHHDVHLVATDAAALPSAFCRLRSAFTEIGMMLSPEKCQTLPPFPRATPQELATLGG